MNDNTTTFSSIPLWRDEHYGTLSTGFFRYNLNPEKNSYNFSCQSVKDVLDSCKPLTQKRIELIFDLKRFLELLENDVMNSNNLKTAMEKFDLSFAEFKLRYEALIDDEENN